jgi:hypothetical protein
MKLGWILGLAAVGAVVGYVASRLMGYGDPALFGGIGAAIGAVIGILVERAQTSRI